ncbi:MAG: NADH:ubiquinone reductase (Na(+)-transporting) subunit F [Candidatus Omnitrophica bacterium]|nr:NADH:ubiquinone reductase (Na(+)-transporting) subunit F [Candidatus Omnitrophota bacterium]MCB9719600.1 NADH:ubiquinone reductase (Na(+)-transporting) subunit F [Candidatus Omnitrophota bacterium]
MSLVSFVFISVLVFTLITLALVTLLTIVKKKVMKQGDCKIFVNDEKEPILVPSGGTLLSALAAEKVYLPSACGGGGTCAMCKCQVVEGGGDILPTETGLIPRGEQKEHFRLSCQVKVREDMKIKIPEEIFKIQKFDCTVRSNNNVATFIKELVLELPKGAHLDFEAGGYIQIDIPPYQLKYSEFEIEKKFHPDWDKFKLWDLKAENDEEIFRAYSMASHPAEEGIVMLNVRIATPPPRDMSLPPGKASSFIFNLKPGDKVTISGPYGEFFIKETKREMVYIGGGAGMAPMRSHLFHLFHTLKTRDRKVSFWYGARSKREMFYTEDFTGIEKEYDNFKYNVALSEPLPEDNWTGPVGFIHQVVLENYLKNHPEPEEIEYYLCGPPMMISAVQNMLDSLGVPEEMIAFDSFG